MPEQDEDEDPAPGGSAAPLVMVGRYPRLAEARVSALALAAKDLAYTIARDGDTWTLSVEQTLSAAAVQELAGFEAEEQRRVDAPPEEPLEKIRPLSLFAAAWILSGCFFAQESFSPSWTDRGSASNTAILQHGEWWRTVTALTLHADLNHLLANLAAGLLFAAFLLPRFGAGAAWLLILLSGIAGNAINAWGYRGESHDSIGASTAVFGALGLLVGAELWARWASPRTRNRWQLVLPLGAGLALLAYLGAGDKREQIDYMAHCWGFVSGLALGGLAEAARLKAHLSPLGQRVAAVATIACIALSWKLALRHPG